jgi:hypothetical protein
MKKIIFLFFVLCSLKLNAQENKVTDLMVKNSPPYTRWVFEYIKLKKDSNFQIALTQNEDLKKQYEKTEKYYKLYHKRMSNSVLNILSSEGIIIVYAINYASMPYLFVPAYFLLGYEFGQFNIDFLLANKFFQNAKILVEKSGVELKKDQWKVTKIDRWRYVGFNKRYNRIKARMLRKHKHLDLVDVDQF